MATSSYTYSSNTEPTKAVFGQSGAGVLALQKQLNALGAGLKEDSLYGPLTQAAYQKYLAGGTSNKTAGDVLGTKKTYSAPTYDDTYDKGLGSLIDYYGNESGQTINEDEIRKNVTSRFQAEIDAINALYADKLRQAKVEGTSRLGTEAAVQGRRGLLGSDFGNAASDRQVQANTNEQDAIEADRVAKISALMNNARVAADNEIAAKKAAKEAGTINYVKYLKERTDNKATNAKKVAASIVAQGLTLNDISDGELKSVADGWGVTVDAIKSAYSDALSEYNDKNKKSGFELSQGQQRYEYDPVTKTYKLVASVAPKGSSGGGSGGTGGGTGGGKFATDLDAIIGNTLATIPSKFGQQTFQAQINKARNDADKISTVAAMVLKNAPAETKTDFSNQAIAVSNIDKAIAEIDKGAKTGFLNSKLQKGFNLFGRDYDPALSAIAAYITSAVQPYRNSVTGAAWGDQEEGEYQQLFGSTLYSPSELRQRLVRIKEIMKGKSAQGLNVYVNPLGTYENAFVQGSGNTPVPSTKNMVTVYSIKTSQPAQIPADKLQAALSSGLFRQ